MYIRRKVFSLLQDETGEERYFSTREILMEDEEERLFSIIDDEEYLEQREFGKVKAANKAAKRAWEISQGKSIVDEVSKRFPLNPNTKLNDDLLFNHNGFFNFRGRKLKKKHIKSLDKELHDTISTKGVYGDNGELLAERNYLSSKKNKFIPTDEESLRVARRNRKYSFDDKYVSKHRVKREILPEIRAWQKKNER